MFRKFTTVILSLLLATVAGNAVAPSASAEAPLEGGFTAQLNGDGTATYTSHHVADPNRVHDIVLYRAATVGLLDSGSYADVYPFGFAEAGSKTTTFVNDNTKCWKATIRFPDTNMTDLLGQGCLDLPGEEPEPNDPTVDEARAALAAAQADLTEAKAVRASADTRAEKAAARKAVRDARKAVHEAKRGLRAALRAAR